jgi:hypothetical protein
LVSAPPKTPPAPAPMPIATVDVPEALALLPMAIA